LKSGGKNRAKCCSFSRTEFKHEWSYTSFPLYAVIFFFNRHCNRCGLWPAQQSLSILSRKSAVTSGTSNPQLGGPVTRTFHLPLPGFWNECERTPAAEDGIMGEKLPRILPKVANSTSLLGSFTCRKFTTWDRRLYFPSEGRRAEDFFSPEKARHVNLGNKGQHAHL